MLDGQSFHLNMYDSTGGFLGRIAREGSGPGELKRPCCLTLSPDGRLWLRDAGNGRYAWYRVGPDGSIEVGSVRMAHNDPYYGVRPGFGIDGHLIDIGHERDTAGTRTLVRFHRDESGRVAKREPVRVAPADSLAPQHTVNRRTDQSQSRFNFSQPFGPRDLVAHSPRGGWAEAISSRYVVRWIGPDSVFDLHIQRDLVGPEVTAAERNEALQPFRDLLPRFRQTLSDLSFGIPERKPPIQNLQFGQDGRLWVHLAQPQGQPHVAHVYDSAGPVLALSWPNSVSLSDGFLSSHFALGVQRDDLDVERVVRLRW